MSKWHQTTWKKKRSYNAYETRMHSSRMRTVRSSSRLLGGGVCPDGCLARGCIAACTRIDTPLWTEWLTDRCKNIAFPQLRFRTVINVGPSDTSVRCQNILRKKEAIAKSQISSIRSSLVCKQWCFTTKNPFCKEFVTEQIPHNKWHTYSRNLPWHNVM